MTTNVPHWIYAGIDGTIATFAIVAGVVGVITANEERWAKTMAVEGHGL